MKFSGVKILQGVEISIFLLIFEWALQPVQRYCAACDFRCRSQTVITFFSSAVYIAASIKQLVSVRLSVTSLSNVNAVMIFPALYCRGRGIKRWCNPSICPSVPFSDSVPFARCRERIRKICLQSRLLRRHLEYNYTYRPSDSRDEMYDGRVVVQLNNISCDEAICPTAVSIWTPAQLLYRTVICYMLLV